MIITPAATPVAAIDQSNVNQSQQNIVQQSEQSRKATDTVQISPRAQELAGSETPISPAQQADIRIAKQAVESEAINQQQPVNSLTHQPANSKIDVVT